MSAEDLERYEAELELKLYQEYKTVRPMFSYVVETERRFYLANDVRRAKLYYLRELRGKKAKIKELREKQTV